MERDATPDVSRLRHVSIVVSRAEMPDTATQGPAIFLSSAILCDNATKITEDVKK